MVLYYQMSVTNNLSGVFFFLLNINGMNKGKET